KALEVISAFMAAAKRPPHEQLPAMAAVPRPPGPPDYRYFGTWLMAGGLEHFASTGLRARAELLAASTAIACERFRQTSGRWPETLDEIPKTILPEIRTDPFDGQPLRYRRFEDGIAVYSVGDPSKAGQSMDKRNPLAGLGLGYRLWNPELRGQPAQPKP